MDAGFLHQVQQFREAFNKTGVIFEMLSKIIVTYSDTDHISGLGDILNDSPQKITVLAHEKEKPYIEAELPPIRMIQMEGKFKILQEERHHLLEC